MLKQYDFNDVVKVAVRNEVIREKKYEQSTRSLSVTCLNNKGHVFFFSCGVQLQRLNEGHQTSSSDSGELLGQVLGVRLSEVYYRTDMCDLLSLVF